jgi:hypothetical protein
MANKSTQKQWKTRVVIPSAPSSAPSTSPLRPLPCSGSNLAAKTRWSTRARFPISIFLLSRKANSMSDLPLLATVERNWTFAYCRGTSRLYVYATSFNEQDDVERGLPSRIKGEPDPGNSLLWLRWYPRQRDRGQATSFLVCRAP